MLENWHLEMGTVSVFPEGILPLSAIKDQGKLSKAKLLIAFVENWVL